jgi:hypothetical protein
MNIYFYRCPLSAPYTIVVAGLDPEGIFTGVEICIRAGGGISDVVPIFIKAFEFVCVLILLGRSEV